jgi:hypothetical protein
MVLLGADPGNQGALCLLDTELKQTEFFCSPQSKHLQASLVAIYNWLAISCRPNYAAIEDVHSMGGMSAKSNFQFGRNLGLLEAVMKLSCDIEYVQPKVWQKAGGIIFKYPAGATPIQKKKIRKVATAKRCLDLYPTADIYGPQGGLKDGRADALMIAHYLSIKYGNTNENTVTRA